MSGEIAVGGGATDQAPSEEEALADLPPENWMEASGATPS